MLYYCESCEAVLSTCDVRDAMRICPVHDHEVLGLPTTLYGDPHWGDFSLSHDTEFIQQVKRTWYEEQDEQARQPREDMPRKEDL